MAVAQRRNLRNWPPEAAVDAPHAPKVRRASLVTPRAARRDVARSDAGFGPRPVPGRSTLDSHRSSRSSPHAAGFPTRCAPGRRAVCCWFRTATGPRSQHVGFTQELQRFAARRWFPHALRAGTSRGLLLVSDRDRSPVAAHWIHAGAPEVRRALLVSPRAARRDVGRSAAGFGPRPVPGRSTLDSRRSSRGSPRVAGFPTRCAPGRRAVRRRLRTATGPRSQHVGFTQELQRFAARRVNLAARSLLPGCLPLRLPRSLGQCSRWRHNARRDCVARFYFPGARP